MNTPLPAAWTLWFYHRDKNVKANNYLSRTHELTGFSTPGEFWSLFSYLQPVTTLSLWSEYQIFRKNIKPMWEDPYNAKGGRWTLRIKRARAPKLGEANYDFQQKQMLYIQDQVPFMWEQLLLAVISGSFSLGRAFDEFEVLGLVISVRRDEFVIKLWNRTADNTTVTSSLREAIVEICQTDNTELNLEYSPHSESLTKVAEKPKTKGYSGTFKKDYKKKWNHEEP